MYLLQCGGPGSAPGTMLQPSSTACRSAVEHSSETIAMPHPGEFREQEVSILLADLRGYTAMGSEHDGSTLIRVLDAFLAAMSEVVLAHGGTVDKFMGDAIMAVFGAPEPCPGHAQHALACAAEMQIAMDQLNAGNRARGLPGIFCGVGVNTGHVMTGWLGSPRHREYCVVGDAVNLAARIESLSLRGQVLVGESTRAAAGDFALTGEVMQAWLKGQPGPVQVYELLGIPSLDLLISRRDLRRSHRVRVEMPFTYQLLEGKRVLEDTHHGIAHDIGYQGVLAELDRPVAPFSDIRLSLDLSPLGYREVDVYGKLLNNTARKGRLLSAIEFTAVTVQSDMDIRQFVQMLLQGYPSDRE